MTWVRYDDNVANHPKVAPLDDATYRLWREAIEWCAQNLTDGIIRRDRLPVTSIRATAARARKLVSQGLWHPAGTACTSKKCPPSGEDGWVIHDYWEYQPTKAEVAADRKARAERTAKWRAAKKGGKPSGDEPGDADSDASRDGDRASSPPRPAPPRKGGVANATSAGPPPGGDGAAAAGGAKDQTPSRPIWADDPCPHGQPGGFKLHPKTGEALCPLCRAEAA